MNELEGYMFGFKKREKKQKQLELPAAIMAEENPVNYDSVLDYLVGLEARDYEKMTKITIIYRNANKEAARVLGVKDQPTTKLKDEKPTDEQVDQGLDNMLHAEDLKTAFLDDVALPEPEAKKEQAPSKETKISINEA